MKLTGGTLGFAPRRLVRLSCSRKDDGDCHDEADSFALTDAWALPGGCPVNHRVASMD